MRALASHTGRTVLVLCAVSSTSCPETDPAPPSLLTCGANLHGDDATCKNGKLDPGELCLEYTGSIPQPSYLHRYDNLTLADYNGDGHLDIRFGNQIRAGAGDGTFAGKPASWGGATNARDCATGDFNGDDIADIACVAYQVNWLDDPHLPPDFKEVRLWFGNPGLAPLPIEKYDDSANYPVRVHAGDFDENGLDDLVIPSVDADVARCSAFLLLRQKDGFMHGPWVPGLSYSPRDCFPLFVHDFDGDGHLDIDSPTYSNGVGLSLGDGKGGFSELRRYPRPTVIAVHGLDLDCDTIPDAIDTGSVPRVWRGLGKATFTLENAELSSGEKTATAADMNGDEEPDILLAGPAGLRILFGDVEFTFSTPTILSEEPSYSEIRVADLNVDGAPDLVVRGDAGADIYLSRP